jgi:hypothetical protein
MGVESGVRVIAQEYDCVGGHWEPRKADVLEAFLAVTGNFMERDRST